jgi:multicomponent Na+:H+ antiporter subunit B
VNTLIVRTSLPFLMALLLISSAFLLFRGHNEPGGGFSGGLIAAAAFSLYAIVHDVPSARRLIRIDPKMLTALGLLATASTGIVALVGGRPFLTASWNLPGGTPLIFDAGVYLVVLGVTLTIIFALKED